jgi:hypothetical protein
LWLINRNPLPLVEIPDLAWVQKITVRLIGSVAQTPAEWTAFAKSAAVAVSVEKVSVVWTGNAVQKFVMI